MAKEHNGMKKSAWIGIALMLMAGAVIVSQWRFTPPPVVNPLELDGAKREAVLAAAKQGKGTAPVAQSPTPKPSLPTTTQTSVADTTNDTATNALTSIELDPRHPYRLKNTAKPASELFSSDAAIVLRNALIDADEPTANLNIPEHLRSEGDPESYVIQAKGRTSDEFRNLLKASGAEIVSYIPNNAYLVKADGSVVTALRASPLVRNAIAYEPYYKLSAALLSGAVKQEPMPPGQPLRVALFPGTKDIAIEKLRAKGAMVAKESEFPYGPLLTVIPRPESLSEIAGMPEVQLLEVYPRYQVLRDLGRIRVGAVKPAAPFENLHDLSGSNVIVGVNGTGVQTNHVDFDSRVVVDTTNFATPFLDGTGHETHVAGIIAANGAATPGAFTNGTVSGANYAGIAPSAKIFPLSIFPATGDAVVGNHPITAGITGAITDITVTFESAGYNEAPSVFIFDYTQLRTNTSAPFQRLSPGQNAIYEAVLTNGRVHDLIPLTNSVFPDGAYGSNYTETNTVVVMTPPWDEFQVITNQARNTNVYIVNNSWSVSVQEYDITAATYDAAVRDSMPHWAGEQAINYVFAAGNSGFGNTDGKGGLGDTIESPATAKNVITVGAIETLRNISTPANNTNNAFNNVLAESDSEGQVSDFSSRGNVGVGLEGEYGRFKPDLVAPGAWIMSSAAANHATNRTVIDDTIGNNNLRYESGTSMAAPFVSGLLALMQDAFDGSPFNRTNSPALNKALLINSARPAATLYDYSPRNFINYQGWGVPLLSNAIPDLTKVKLLETIGGSESATVVMVDQSGLTTNRLRTGQTHNFDVAVGNDATNQSLRITLTWTDPPGNPAAGIKLVNDLDLVVSNTATAEVFVGNFISSGSDFTTAGSLDNTNAQERAVADFVNNVENVFIRGPFTNGANNFRVYVSANRVNVNATGLETNDIAQDYVLVISTADGADVTVTHNPSQDTVTNLPSQFLLNGIPLLEQRVGAYSTFQSNVLIGTTNQWNFYVFTNSNLGPITNVSTNISGTITNSSTNVITPLTAGTNVAFATFFPPNLGRTRNVDADIDVYVTRSSDPPPGGHLTTNNIREDIFTSTKTLRSTNRGGLEVITLNDASIGDVFYIGVKSEDQQAGQYSFLAISTDQQFTQTNADGSFDVPFFTLPSLIPDGNPGSPGGTNLMGIMLVPTNIYNPVFSNSIAHENHSDLSVSLTHGSISVFTRNHSQRLQPGGIHTTQASYFNATLYDPNNAANTSGASLADGPGDMADFVGESAIGAWLLQVTDDAINHTGAVLNASMRIGDTGQNVRRNQNGNTTTVIFDVDPGESFIDVINVPITATNMTITVQGAPPSTPGVDLLVQYNAVPPAPFFTNVFTTNINGINYSQTNIVTTPNVISLLAPLTASSQIAINSATSPFLRIGPWFTRVINNTSTRLTLTNIIQLEHDFGIGGFDGHDVQLDLDLIDLASTNLALTPGENRLVAGLEVAIGVEHPRPADLVYELFSPLGTRVLIAENRGDLSRTNFYANFAEGTNGSTSIITNLLSGGMHHYNELLPIKAITNQFTNGISPPLLLSSNSPSIPSIHSRAQAISSEGSRVLVAGSLITNTAGAHTNWGMVFSYSLPMTTTCRPIGTRTGLARCASRLDCLPQRATRSCSKTWWPPRSVFSW